MGIVDEDIRKVVDNTDIIALIGEYTILKRAGRNWSGLCTFHDERTPSMSVSPEGVYHCFGCQASGDSITFLRNKLGLEFQDAVEMLASRIGYELKYTSATDSQSHSRRKRMKEAVTQAMEWYHNELMHADSGGPARAYLKSRGYTKDIVTKWKLGWAPDGTNNLSQALDIDLETLKEAELVMHVRQGQGEAQGIDFFRSRVMFPIFNQTGDALGFGGRVMPGQDGPKYLNSRDSKIYSKKKELYGLHKASKHIVSEKRAVVVEGYTDVIGLESIGVSECVATCGTALTEDHLRVLGRLSKNIVLAFDPDTAGSNAMVRSHEARKALEEMDLEIKVANLSGKDDPGDLASKDPELLMETLSQPTPLLEFRIAEALKNFPLDTGEDRLRASQEGGKIIAEFIGDSKVAAISSLLDDYVNYVEEHTRVDANTILAGIRVAIEKSVKPVKSQTPPINSQRGQNDITSPKTTANLDSIEHKILSWAIHDAEQIPEYVTEDFFEFETEKNVFSALLEFENLAEACSQSPEESAQLLRSLIVAEPPQGDISSYLARLIFSTAERKCKEMMRDLKALAREMKDTENIRKLTQESAQFQKSLDLVRENNLKMDKSEYSVLTLLSWIQ